MFTSLINIKRFNNVILSSFTVKDNDIMKMATINKIDKSLRSAIKCVIKHIDYHIYQNRLPKLRNEIFTKDKIRVVFFPISIGMWKNDYLFKLLMEHPRFDPYIVSFFVPADTRDYQLRNQEEMRSFFQAKGYPYIDMYNSDTNEWFDVKSFCPDVVFYTQAVDEAYPQYKIKSLWKNCIFFYIPYCLGMEDQRRGYNTLLDNICERFFAPSEFHKKEYSSFFLNKGKNVVNVGYPSFDYLTNPQEKPVSKWKESSDKKRVIWAPHHSITQNDVLSNSNFLVIADEMIELAKKYQDSVQFVFKPHPRLRPKLEKIEGWGVEKTAKYFECWETMPNTSIENGEYYDLFLTSDAMIHDCSTFMAEYLLTGKPVAFVLRKDAGLNLNSYANKCYEQHYELHSMPEIENFIKEVVIKGNDLMKNRRMEFVHNYLQPKGEKSVAENIFNEILSELK